MVVTDSTLEYGKVAWVAYNGGTFAESVLSEELEPPPQPITANNRQTVMNLFISGWLYSALL